VKFPARVSYGLRAAIVLAENYGNGPVLGKKISAAEGLPTAYLEQIMASLARAGLVAGTRGAGGGYMLARAPSSITAAELITALSGPLQLSDCPDGGACCGDDSPACPVAELFSAADAAMRGVFNASTLADLAERRTSLRTEAQMFYI